jgi:hypothetical protein
MAYTYTWSNAVPLGSANANTADDAIRQLRAEIEERMDTICAAGSLWSTSSPTQDIALDFSSVGAQSSVHIYFHHTILRPTADEDDVYVSGPYTRSDNDTAGVLFGGLRLPVGCTLTDFHVIVDRLSASSAEFDLRRTTFDGSVTDSSIATKSVTTSGVSVEQIYGPAGTHEIADDYSYYIKCWPGAASQIRIYGFRATVDVTDLGDYL